ncbi:MAG: diguanylate cyclase [Chloroflexi bacterium]|nr:diguanylate cyclase [Chloroflexota bacterium]
MPAFRSRPTGPLPALPADRPARSDPRWLAAAGATLVVLLLIGLPDGRGRFADVVAIGLLLAIGWAAVVYVARRSATDQTLTEARAAAQRQAAAAQLARRAINAADLGAVLDAAVVLVARTLAGARCQIYERQIGADVLQVRADSGQVERDRVEANIRIGIEAGQQPYGVLEACRRADRGFGAAELEFLSEVAEVLGAAVLRHQAETARDQREAELTHRAFHDSLTGLPNRALFEDRLKHALTRAERDATPVAVLLMDLDDFKSINDTLGHSVGDHVLFQVADRLTQCLREGDTAARLGGDEFVIVLEGATETEAAQAVTRITEVQSKLGASRPAARLRALEPARTQLVQPRGVSTRGPSLLRG